MRFTVNFFIFFMACQDSTPSKKPSTGLPNPHKNGSPKEPPEEDFDIPHFGCSYTIQSVQPEWTAYKFSDKTPVSGSFNRVLLSSKKTAPTIADALKGLSLKIDTSSVESNNAARDKTIAKEFFARFQSKSTIHSTILAANGDEKKGTLLIQLDMNNTQKAYTFTYQKEDSSITANAVMDMMDFDLQQPLAAIHSACTELHMGSDGIAKTWSEVALRAVIQFDKTCP